MLSKERLEAYRRMTPAQKWAETLALADYGWQMLLRLAPEERAAPRDHAPRASRNQRCGGEGAEVIRDRLSETWTLAGRAPP